MKKSLLTFSALMLCLLLLFNPIVSAAGSTGTTNAGTNLLLRIDSKTHKYGYVDTTGKIVVQPKYQYADEFKEELALVRLGEKFGYIDKKGNEVIKPRFTSAKAFSDGWAYTNEGFIDKKGKVVLSKSKLANYESVGNFFEGMASVATKDWKFGFIDKTGKEVVKPVYSYALDFSEGFAVVMNEDFKAGFIDKKGKVIVAPKYEDLQSFSDGLAAFAVKESGTYKSGFIDKNGNTVIVPKYSRAFSFSDGLALVVNDKEKYIYIDKKGKEILMPNCIEARSFSEGLAAVITDGNTGNCSFIDKKGKVVIKLNYGFYETEDFKNGFAKVTSYDDIDESIKEIIYINKSGKRI